MPTASGASNCHPDHYQLPILHATCTSKPPASAYPPCPAGIVDDEEDLPWTYYVPPDEYDDKIAPPPATPDSLFPGAASPAPTPSIICPSYWPHWPLLRKRPSPCPPLPGWDPVKKKKRAPGSQAPSRLGSAASSRSTRQSMWFEMNKLRQTGGQVRNARVVPEPARHTQAAHLSLLERCLQVGC